MQSAFDDLDNASQQHSDQDLFEELCLDLTPEEADQMMKIQAAFSGPPVMTPLEPQPFPMILESRHNPMEDNALPKEQRSEPAEISVQEEKMPEAGFNFSDSLDLTPAEFEQFMAMNAAFGGPLVVPPPKIASEFTSSFTQPPVCPAQISGKKTSTPFNPSTDPIKSLKPDPPITKVAVGAPESDPAFSLSDSLDLTPEEYEQFVAMNAAFGGPSVIPPPRMTFKEAVQLAIPKVSLARPASLNLQTITSAEGDGESSPRSPDLARNSAVNYQCQTEPISQEDTLTKDITQGDNAFWDDLNDSVIKNAEFVQDSSTDGEENASLVASSQEDEGNLTPVFEQPPSTFDLVAIPVSNERAPVPTSDHTVPRQLEDNKISKGKTIL